MKRIETLARLNSMTDEYKRNILIAKNIIHKSRVVNLAISWSSGKDSTCMAHLIKSLYPDTPIIIQFDDCDWKEKENYVNRVAKKQGWNYHRVEPDFSVYKMALETGINEKNLCSTSHKLTIKGFILPLQEKINSLMMDGYYIGTRRQESKHRARNEKIRGSLYQLKSGYWHCTPVIGLSTIDVFTYLFENKIEINPYYFKNKIKKSEDIRLSWAIPSCSYDNETIAHLRLYYPERYRQLREDGVL